MKILSIIIPSYNVGKYLRKTVDSILASDQRKDIEVIIVNDGSKDNTLEIANEYKERYSDSVVVIDKENGGHGSTINAGSKLASGKYMKVIDGDDWVDTEALDEFIEKLRMLDTDIVFSAYKKIYTETNKEESIKFSRCPVGTVLQLKDYIDDIGGFYCIHSITFRTEIYKSCEKTLDEHCFYVDQEYVLYPIRKIKTFAYVDAIVYQYRLDRPGQSVDMKSKIKNKEMHLKIINSLIDFNRKNDTSDEYSRFVIGRIVSLVNIQYSILLSMETNIDNYRKLKEFRSMVIRDVPKEYYTGISKILNHAPILYWIVSLRYRRKYLKK